MNSDAATTADRTQAKQTQGNTHTKQTKPNKQTDEHINAQTVATDPTVEWF